MTHLRCFSENPSLNSSLKVLRQVRMKWARDKIEKMYFSQFS